MATKKQSRPIVKGLANPRGVTAVYGTPIDWGSLPEKIRIGRRIANGRFKLEAHYPAKHFNDKKEYIDKRKAGSYCRFYDNKSPFFVARTVWDETSHPGMHMVVKNRNETYRFIVTPKANDPTEATVIGAYLVHRQDGVPVLCSGPIGELKAIGDDGDFKVTAYKKHGIRCPKKDSSGKDLAGEIPKTFGYTKRTSKKGPRKTAKDYCKPSHTFKHPTDIKRAEVVEEMDAYIDEQCTCLMCNWSGAYSDLAFLDDTPEGGPPGMDFMLVCPSCGQGDWLDDMMAEGYDEPCFSCDGIGTWDDGECEYCHGSGMMSDTLRAEMAIYNSEYFDADCGCFKKAETDRFQWTFLWKPKSEGWGNSLYAANLKDAKEQILKKYPKGSSWFQRADLSTLTKNPTVNKERWSNWDSQWNAEGKSLSFIDWAKQEEASHLKKYGTESFSAETVMIAGKKNDKMYSVAHIKGMQDKEGFTPEAIIGGNEELDNPLYAKIVEDGAKKGLYENHAESFSAECSECNTPFLKDGINSNLTQFMYFEKGMSWPCWCNECFLKDYKQWSRANESPDMPSFEELVKLRLDAESFAADWLVKRKKCKRPYCTKPIIVDFNGYCSSRCQAKNEPESYGGGAESFSADVEMIECGNCDETFTIDEGLDIGGIDYCEECYDTMKGKRPSIVTVPYLRSLGKDAESFEASRGLHKKGSKNLSPNFLPLLQK